LKSFEEQHDVYRERGQSKISPFFVPMFIADIAAGVVSMRFNAAGPTTPPCRHAPRARTRSATRSAHPVRRRDIIISGGAEGDRDADGDRRLREHDRALRANDDPATASRRSICTATASSWVRARGS
jgi:3-oxoacyl-[acyl-carrier-protein] synthase II